MSEVFVSGIRDSNITRQDFSQLSAILSSYYPIIENESELSIGDVLIETMPDQVLRQKFNGLSFFYGIENPKNPPFTLILKYKKLPLRPLHSLPALRGKKKCYLSKVDDEPYVKDGDVYLFTLSSESILAYEVRAYVKRWGYNTYMYSDKLPDKFFDECGEIVPTNPHAEIIKNIVEARYDLFISQNDFEKKIYALLSNF